VRADAPLAAATLTPIRIPGTVLQSFARQGGGQMSKDNGMRLGWIGAGRMGFALASRLLAAGHDVAVWNRTRAKAEPLADLGATIVDAPADLADRDIVFTMVGGDGDFQQVVLGETGLPVARRHRARVLVDSTTISPGASQVVRDAAEQRGTAVLAAPCRATRRSSPPAGSRSSPPARAEAFDLAAPYLDLFGAGVTYVGEGDRAGWSRSATT
jgi:3-hydroxyisobutyrate dehydrogenase-like beta-hydroxyacid dehydrogenase